MIVSNGRIIALLTLSFSLLPHAPALAWDFTQVPVHPKARGDHGRARHAQVLALNAEGLKTRYDVPFTEHIPNGWVTVKRTHSGVPKEHYRPWVVGENLFVTPAFQQGDRPGVATLVGLAAFPLGATISITNEDMEARQMADHTVTKKPTRRTGSLQVALPAPAAGGNYRLVVEYPKNRMGDASRTVRLTHHFRLPAPGESELQAGQVRFHPVALDQGSHTISSGMYLQGWPNNPPEGGAW